MLAKRLARVEVVGSTAWQKACSSRPGIQDSYFRVSHVAFLTSSTCSSLQFYMKAQHLRPLAGARWSPALHSSL